MIFATKRRLVYCFSVIFFIAAFPVTAVAITPSEVYQKVQYIIADIEAIRAKKGVDKPARVAGVQIAKTPLHVYTKGLELYEKLYRYQASNNNTISQPPPMPVKKTTPAEVFALMQSIHTHTQAIKEQLGVTSPAQYVDLVPGKTPSDVYEIVWQASYLMDGLTDAIDPKFVFENTKKITRALMGLSKHTNKHVALEKRVAMTGKKPVDANIEGYKVLFQLVSLERKLGLQTVRVPSFPAGKIEPSDVYDTTNTILAEISRIRIKVPFDDENIVFTTPEKVTPNDVVGQMRVIQSILKQLNV